LCSKIKFIPEPVVSLLTFSFGWYGPTVWAQGWLLLIPAGCLTKKFMHKIVTIIEDSDEDRL